MPSPAGVSAPVSVMPTVTSGSSIFFVNSCARLAQPRRVVREERVVDQIGDALLAVDATRIDALAAQKPALLVRRVRRTRALPLLGRPLLLAPWVRQPTSVWALRGATP